MSAELALGRDHLDDQRRANCRDADRNAALAAVQVQREVRALAANGWRRARISELLLQVRGR